MEITNLVLVSEKRGDGVKYAESAEKQGVGAVAADNMRFIRPGIHLGGGLYSSSK